MSVCTFIASDAPLASVVPERVYPLVINIDEGTVYDGGADDNFFLRPFKDVQFYTDKEFGVYLAWQFTEGRARKLLDYIGNALKHAPAVEIWTVWLMDSIDYDVRPVVHKCRVPFTELTVDDIDEIASADVWNTPDPRDLDRPSFYCLEIVR